MLSAPTAGHDIEDIATFLAVGLMFLSQAYIVTGPPAFNTMMALFGDLPGHNIDDHIASATHLVECWVLV
jgi:hypothetical protein